MATFKCKNFGSCSRADAGEDVSLPGGADDKCPECGSSLVRVGEEDASDGGGRPKGRQTLIALVAGALILIVIGLGVGYANWRRTQAVVLRPEAAPPTTPPSVVASSVPAPPPPTASETVAIAKPPPMVSSEVVARRTCDEATKAKQPDADKVCRRATAVTLMNSGVLSAVDGKLGEAERDYLAAKDKDPDFPELYFNLAVLKARQNKGSEVIDNLTLASVKGFTQFSAIKTEPAIQKLKSDPVMKAKIEAFENK